MQSGWGRALKPIVSATQAVVGMDFLQAMAEAGHTSFLEAPPVRDGLWCWAWEEMPGGALRVILLYLDALARPEESYCIRGSVRARHPPACPGASQAAG